MIHRLSLHLQGLRHGGCLHDGLLTFIVMLYCADYAVLNFNLFNMVWLCMVGMVSARDEDA